MLPSTAMNWDPSTVQALQSLPYPLARHKSMEVEQGSVLSTKPQDELCGNWQAGLLPVAKEGK